MTDNINHPTHYGGENNQYEAIKVIEAWDLDFHLGNVLKYISRAGKKIDTVEDLKKAKWYLERKIMILEKSNNQNWKYPEKNEYPENGSQVVVKCENTGFTICAEYLFDKFVHVNTTTQFTDKVIAWCDLPIFNNV